MLKGRRRKGVKPSLTRTWTNCPGRLSRAISGVDTAKSQLSRDTCRSEMTAPSSDMGLGFSIG